MPRPLRSPLQASIDDEYEERHPNLRLRRSRIPERFTQLLELPPGHDQLRTREQRDALQALIPDALDRMWAAYKDSAKADGLSLKRVLQTWAADYPDEVEKGLVLLGPAGRGKTMGMCLLLAELTLEKNVFVRYVPYAELVQMRQRLIKLDRVTEDGSDDVTEYNRLFMAVEKIENYCDVLLLDDVGKEYRGSGTGYSDDLLDRLLRARLDSGKTTLINSNLTVDEWESYNSSMASFVHEVGDVFTVTEGRDHRVRKSSMRDRLEREDTSARPSQRSGRVS